MAAKKKSKIKPFLIGGAIIGGILLIPVIINKLRPTGTVKPPGYEPLDTGNGAEVTPPRRAFHSSTLRWY